MRVPEESEKRVTWAELFFDLVFVFAVTQVSTLLHHEAGSMPCLSVVGEIDGRTLELFAAAVCELIEATTGDQARLDLTRQFMPRLTEIGIQA